MVACLAPLLTSGLHVQWLQTMGARVPRELRRLAAIVSADVAGYSRLMGRDESGTLAALKALRHDLIDPRIAEHGGRIVKTIGDGLLLEFASVVDAVRCVVELQTAMATHNADVQAERRIELRRSVPLERYQALLPEPIVAEHLHALGVRYDADVAAACSTASEALSALRGNVALMLHRDGASEDDAVAAFERWGLLPRARAEKSVRFLTDPTWSSYISCYVEGLPLCRRYVAGDVTRFEQLLTDPLTPQELAAA